MAKRSNVHAIKSAAAQTDQEELAGLLAQEQEGHSRPDDSTDAHPQEDAEETGFSWPNAEEIEPEETKPRDVQSELANLGLSLWFQTKMDALQIKIDNSSEALKLARHELDELRAVKGEERMAFYLDHEHPGASTAKPSPAKAPNATATARAPRTPRTPDAEKDKLADEVVAFLRANPKSSARQICDAVKIDPKGSPYKSTIKRLHEEKRIRQEGQKIASRYFAT